MTVSELSERMTSAELSEWIAYDLFFDPIGKSWEQTGVVASAVVAPYCKRGKVPKPEDFIPKAKMRQTPEEMLQELEKLKSMKRKE